MLLICTLNKSVFFRLQDAGYVDLALALSFLKLWGGEVSEMVKGSCKTSRSERDEVSVARQA